MLSCTCLVFRLEKARSESGDHFSRWWKGRADFLRQEGRFQASVFIIQMPQAQHEVAQVGTIERAVNEAVQSAQFVQRSTHYKVEWGRIHQLRQPPCIADDGPALAPCDRGSDEANGLGIFTGSEGTRYLDRIIRYEGRCGIPVERFIQELLQIRKAQLPLLRRGLLPTRQIGNSF